MSADKSNWEVCFYGNFWGHSRPDTPGTELAVRRAFHWNGRDWLVPAVYLCKEGIVTELCLRASPQDLTGFIQRWDLLHEASHTYTPEERIAMKREHPLHMGVELSLTFQGKALRKKHSSSLTWLPPACLEGEMDWSETARAVLDHYDLPPEQGWAVSRAAFAWDELPQSPHGVLEIRLTQEPVSFSGSRFTVTAPGEQFPLTHPVTGELHTLTVQELLPEQLDNARLHPEYEDFPSHCLGMTYTLSPDLSPEEYALYDTAEHDPPRYKQGEKGRSGAIGVILSPHRNQTASHTLRTAVSSLHYEPVRQVEWRSVFRTKTAEELLLEFTI